MKAAQQRLVKLFLILCVIFSVAMVLGVVGYLAKNKTAKISQPQVSVILTPTPTMDLNSDNIFDWQSYRNEKMGFEMKYPQSWVINDYHDLNCPTAYEDLNDCVYIEHIIHGATIARIIVNISDFSAKENLDRDNSNLPEIYHQDAEEILMGGQKGYKIYSGGYGEVPEEGNHIYLEKDRISSYEIASRWDTGCYLSAKNDETDPEFIKCDNSIKQESAMIEKILSTFKFAKNGTVISSPQPTPVVEWKTYINEKYGFEFKYPGNLKPKTEFEGSYLFGNNLWSVDDILDNSSGVPIINIPLYEIYKSDSFIMELRIGVNSKSEKVAECLKFDCSGLGEECLSKKTINEIDFTILPIEGGGMSHYLHGKSYRTIHGNLCFAIEQINFGTSATGDLDSVRNKYSNQSTDTINQILSTFKFLN